MAAISAVVPLAQDVVGPLAVLAAVSVAAVLAAASVALVLAVDSVAVVLAAASVASVLAAGSVVAVLVADFVAAVLVAGSVVAVLVAGSVAAILVAGSVTAVLVAGSGTVVLVAVHVAVQVAVFSTVLVGVDVDRRCDPGPIVGATMPSPDLPLIFWPFPTLDGGAAVLPLSPFVFPEPLVAGVFAFSLWNVGNFFTFAGGGMSLPSLHGTLAALMPGTLQNSAVAGTTVPGNVVAEVLGWDLESLALVDGRGGCREEVNVS
ncbi:hypothetical protein NDU88_001399 [Pleurodeles waltl]|uniref:Uncharacterized protein n=1 Tax=Pleurodeles waltl TaxID=8319 RepID=A0AAV7UU25_PLEWA|nr:hypothetical protein NDU88_001399 [Pleurodeles waltl]